MSKDSYKEIPQVDNSKQSKLYSYSCDSCGEVQQVRLKSEVNPYQFKPNICPNKFCREKEKFSLIIE